MSATVGDKDPRVKVWLSATQIDLVELCERKYFFDRVLKMRSPTSKAQQLGIDVENHIEADLKNGVTPPDDAAGKIAREMLTLLPARGTPGMEFQSDFRIKLPLNYALPSGAMFGVIGKKDLRSRGQWVKDFKTTSDPAKWMKTPQMLVKDIQAQLYAWDELQNAGIKGCPPSMPMQWVYGKTKGKPLALDSKLDMTQAQADVGITRARSAALRILELKTPGVKVEDTGFSTSACDAFGGCAHRAYCPARAKNLAQLLGFEEEKKMGLKDRLKASLGIVEQDPAPAIEAAAPVPATAPPPVATIPVPAQPVVTGEAACIACGGLGHSSKGGPCSPCHGTGYKAAKGPDYIPSAESVATPSEAPSAPPAEGINPPDALLSPDDQLKPEVIEPPAPVGKRTRRTKAEIQAAEAAAAIVEAIVNPSAPRAPVIQETVVVTPTGAQPGNTTIAEGGYILVLDGATAKGVSCALDYLVQKACRTAAERAGVADYRLVEYGKGPAFVLLAFAELAQAEPQHAPILTLNSKLPEAQAITGWLIDRASIVIRGLV